MSGESTAIIVKTGVILGVLLKEKIITFDFHFQDNTIIPAAFRKDKEKILFFNRSDCTDHVITLSTPSIRGLAPYIVSVKSRNAIDITEILSENAAVDNSKIHLTASIGIDTDESMPFYACAEAIGLLVTYKKEIKIGTYITAQIDGNKVVFYSDDKRLIYATELFIKNEGDSSVKMTNVPADENGIVTAVLPVSIREGTVINIWLSVCFI